MSGSPGFPIIRFCSAAVIKGTSCPFCVVASGSGVATSVSTMASSAFSPGARPNGFETEAPWITGVGGGGGAAWVGTGAAAADWVLAAGEVVDAGVSDDFAAVAVCDGDVVLTSDADAGAAACAEVAFASFEACVAGDVVFAMLSLAGVDCAVGFVTAAGARAGAGDDTVADSTLAVILGEPAELGAVFVGADCAGAGATFALASMAAAI